MFSKLWNGMGCDGTRGKEMGQDTRSAGASDGRIHLKAYSSENTVTDVCPSHSSGIPPARPRSRQTQKARHVPSPVLINREHQRHHRLKVEGEGPILLNKERRTRPQPTLGNSPDIRKQRLTYCHSVSTD